MLDADMQPLSAVVVIDYQNVHLVGHEAFAGTRHRPRHECLIDPLRFAETLLSIRNAGQRQGHPHAALQRVLVYRGLPSATYDPVDYGRSMAQKAHWERDRRVHVDLRPLRYDVARDSTGPPRRDSQGRYTVFGKREKGVDVLCALACVREAQRADTDVVILASHDSDLEPAISEVRALGTAKIEGFRWASPDSYVYQLGSALPRGQRPWVTTMDERAFRASWDTSRY